MGNFWSQPLRVECKDKPQLITVRTIVSALWFVNNKALEHRILGYLAKYQQKYGVILYAFSLVGNHFHIVAQFPNGRRSEFMRDFNARVAEAVRIFVPEFLGGPLFGRRFTPQVLPLTGDLEKYFFYCALQPVSSGLTEKISDYDSYNSFQDAASGRVRKYKIFNYGHYNAAKRANPNISKEDFWEEYELKFERLPHLKDLPQAEYKKVLLKTLEEKRIEIVKDRIARGKSFFGKENLRKVVPGSLPKSTKKGGLRPLVLSSCMAAKSQFLSWYFAVVAEFKKASKQYRQGFFDVEFPPGTFRPSGFCLCAT